MVKRVSFVFLFVIVDFITTSFAATVLNTKCVTPNGEEALCIPIFSCTVLTDALALNDFNAISFAQKSQCGYENVPLVCCGTSARLDVPDAFSIFYQPQPDDDPVVLEDFITTLLPNRTICGVDKEGNRILGGKIADIYEFPWMVGLEYRSRHDKEESAGIRCGGSLINNRYVLTAAHCLDTIEFELVRAWLGDWKISSDPDCFNQTNTKVCNEPVLKLNIARKIPHQFYHNGLNDVAVLKLERNVTFTDYIRPICLPPPNLPWPKIGSRLTVTGWGYTNQWGDLSDFKLKLEVPVISNDECRTVATSRTITEAHVCAGGEFGKDSCSGDSGGPLMRKYADAVTNKFQWYVEGIISWGSGCGRAGIPGVYTRTVSYIYWILFNISQEEITSDFDFDTARKKVLPSREVCGLESRVTAFRDETDQVTKIYEFPWVVRIEYGLEENNRTFICGGSLINNRYVLTAASCLNNLKHEHIRVWLGDWRSSTNPDCASRRKFCKLCNDNVLKLRISQPIIFPYHTTFGINDITLLKLEREVEFTDYIRPICLPPHKFPNLPDKTNFMVSGWGAPSEFGEISDYKIKLKKVLISTEDCIDLYKKQYQGRAEYLRHNTHCVEGVNDKHLCKDIGGLPLMKEYDDGLTEQRQYFQVGINSLRLGCGVSDEPTIFIKVHRFMNWVVRTIAEES